MLFLLYQYFALNIRLVYETQDGTDDELESFTSDGGPTFFQMANLPRFLFVYVKYLENESLNSIKIRPCYPHIL
jgi:hypothetical protein